MTESVGDLFSSTYAQARARLLAAAAARGLAVESHVHPLPGAAGELLALDVVRDGPADARDLLLLTSAVHGVEGHAGSGVQLGLLTRRAALQAMGGPDLAILHVHAVNPHGFSHGRRVTQENVDLNRNFVDFSLPLPLQNERHRDYAALHPLLLPPVWPPPADNEAQLAVLRDTWGPRRYQLGLSGGQHTHADGLFYGGAEPTWSNRCFRDVLRRHVAAARRLVWIDLHTGLGPYGVGERIFASFDTGATLQRARRWWGEGITSVETGTSTSIPMTGPIQCAVPDECPHVETTGICLEFGTVSSTVMHLALRADHWLHLHPDAGEAVAGTIRRQLRDAFYPDHEDWKQLIWSQGAEAAEQAVAGLAASR